MGVFCMTVSISGTSGITFPDGSLQTAAASPYVLRNRIINGDMRIDQRNAGAEVNPATNGGYSVDRWLTGSTAASKFKVQQNAGSITPPSGFNYYLGCTSLSAYTAGAAEAFGLQQRIEGYNISDLAWGTANAKTITLSFWAYSSLTGTFGGSLRNSASDRSYPFSYTISSANTWTQISITIAGDTTGTWLTTNGIGISVNLSIGSGSTYSGTAGAWVAGDIRSTTGATSVVGTSGATFYITGVQLEIGSTATPFERRMYGTELALCQRYYYRMKAAGANTFFGSGFNESTTVQQTLTIFPVTMRDAPTAVEQNGTAGDYRINHTAANTACSVVPSFNGADIFSARTQMQVASGLTTGQGSIGRSTNSNAYLAWSAEL